MQMEEPTRAEKQDVERVVFEMFNRAWDLIEVIPQGPFRDAQFDALRLMVCTFARDWTAGLKLCEQAGRPSDWQLRSSMVQFYLTYAKHPAPEEEMEDPRILLKKIESVGTEGTETLIDLSPGQFAAPIPGFARLTKC